jgi:putative transposase
MPRAARTVLIDCPLHIVQRGINRGTCFFSDDDYLTYLRYLSAFSTRFGCSVHAYCLMTNHVHLLLTPHATDACALLMKNLSQRYVQGVNQRLGRTGTLWEGRFHSSLVTSERYVLTCYRYIDLNPVEAGLVATPGDYRWSSYVSNAQGAPSGFLKPHEVYAALGSEPQARASCYKAMCEVGIPALELQEIRKAIRVGSAIGMRRRSRGRPSKLDEKNRVCPYFRG